MGIKKTFPDWVIGAVITLFFLFITFTGVLDFTDPIEMKSFDLRARLAAPDSRNPDIELVVITDDDLSELGRFPWSRDIIARCIHNLSLAGARVIALDILFSEPEEAAGLETVKALKEKYEALGLEQEIPGRSFYRRLTEAVKDLDNDAKLQTAIKEAGNVVLPVYFDTLSSGRDKEIAPFIARDSLKNIEGLQDEWAVSSLLWEGKMKPVLPLFAEATAGIGHANLFPDRDGAVRSQIHVLGYLKDTYFPSFPLVIVKVFSGLEDKDITVTLGQGISLSMNPSTLSNIPVIDPQMRTLIRWNQGPSVTFHRTPFTRVYKNEIQTSLFRDKIVIIGPTAPGIGERFVTPISGQLPGVEIVANAVANILNQNFFSRPKWFVFLEPGILILFGLFISLLLPRMSAGEGAVVTLGLFLFYGVLGTTLFFTFDIWLKFTPPLLLLLLGYILVVSKHFFITEKTKERVEADSVENNKMLGLSFQQQGLLDLALEKFRKLSPEEAGVKDLLYNLGLDFERKRQFSKALSTYNFIIEDGMDFKDLAERIPKLKDAEASMIFGSALGQHPGDIGPALLDMDTKPTLGRYEITGELGRGAMGVVFKGQDPTIHRTVAIKTVRLADLDEEILGDVKKKFFREAESAGLLTHPNIVTIYDCGEEHDLAFIAMEYLEGEDLKNYRKKGSLLPIREALSIVTQVAEALDYAHSKGVVHRDIKPANIMRVKDTNEIKVTDFGIARITASSKTSSGVVIGTPFYMSPEQVAGKKVDGRSDIFSLGVVLFEMLTGQKPFKAADMTALMYQVTNERHPSPRAINSKIPPVIEKIIDKALEKDKARRYQTAGKMAEHLKLVIAKIDEIQAKRAEQAAN
jgi:eukaryotic-like serine/threonine-protein kinase